MSREKTNQLLEMISDGSLDAEQVALMCLKYMSEAEVADMIIFNDLSELFLNREESK